ncbi:Transcriptional regulator [Irineochytrium annulatum]|nr:Transcriptional regulator [Irineochytrium annulatum]
MGSLPGLNWSPLETTAGPPRLYQQYTKSISPQGQEIPPAKGPNDPPNLLELQRLTTELEALQAAANSKGSQIQTNLEVLQQWLKKNEKPAGIPTTNSGSSSSGSPNPATLMGNLANGGVAMKLEKLGKPLGKVKVKDEMTFKSELEGMFPRPSEQSPNTVHADDVNKKRKRDKDDGDGSKEVRENILVRRTDDGSVKIAITHNGKLKLKIPASSPPPPPSSLLPPSAPSQAKPPSRAGTPKLLKSKSSKDSADKMKPKIKKGGNNRKSEIIEEPPVVVKEEEPTIIVEGDYSKAKAPPNQIPIAQFWGFCEPQFFRPLQDEDFRFLQDRGDEVTPYIIPLLGRHYLEQWAEEEGAMLPMFDVAAVKPAVGQNLREYEEMDDTVYGGDVYLGSLTERILSSLREEGIQTHGAKTLEEDAKAKPPKFRSTTEMMVLEDRLKNEIRYLGLLGDDNAGDGNAEDDEITAELRRLQSELKDFAAENNRKKERLREVAAFHRGWEQYNSVLDTISKQIEADYMKRFAQKSNPKQKKQKKVSQAPRNLSEGTMELVKKRRQLIDNIGSLFPPEQITVPSTSVATPCQKSLFLQLTNQFENSQDRFQFDYCENIRFCTGTGDAIKVIEKYANITNHAPNEFSSIVSTLATVSGANVNGLDSYCARWWEAAHHQTFRNAQLARLDTAYYYPAQAIWQKYGLTYQLSMSLVRCNVRFEVGRLMFVFQMYDSCVQHGPDGVPDIIKKISVKPPSKGGDEAKWLASYLKARTAYLTDEGESGTLYRVRVYQKMLEAGTVHFNDTLEAFNNDIQPLSLKCDLDLSAE